MIRDENTQPIEVDGVLLGDFDGLTNNGMALLFGMSTDDVDVLGSTAAQCGGINIPQPWVECGTDRTNEAREATGYDDMLTVLRYWALKEHALPVVVHEGQFLMALKGKLTAGDLTDDETAELVVFVAELAAAHAAGDDETDDEAEAAFQALNDTAERFLAGRRYTAEQVVAVATDITRDILLRKEWFDRAGDWFSEMREASCPGCNDVLNISCTGDEALSQAMAEDVVGNYGAVDAVVMATGVLWAAVYRLGDTKADAVAWFDRTASYAAQHLMA